MTVHFGQYHSAFCLVQCPFPPLPHPHPMIQACSRATVAAFAVWCNSTLTQSYKRALEGKENRSRWKRRRRDRWRAESRKWSSSPVLIEILLLAGLHGNGWVRAEDVCVLVARGNQIPQSISRAVVVVVDASSLRCLHDVRVVIAGV